MPLLYQFRVREGTQRILLPCESCLGSMLVSIIPRSRAGMPTEFDFESSCVAICQAVSTHVSRSSYPIFRNHLKIHGAGGAISTPSDAL